MHANFFQNHSIDFWRKLTARMHEFTKFETKNLSGKFSYKIAEF